LPALAPKAIARIKMMMGRNTLAPKSRKNLTMLWTVSINASSKLQDTRNLQFVNLYFQNSGINMQIISIPHLKAAGKAVGGSFPSNRPGFSARHERESHGHNPHP
jgi:hypothetical protein